MSKPSQKQKLYCYIDETGQHTDGQLFFVSVVILSDDRDDLRRELAVIEESSGKHARKWTRATIKQREAYMRGLLRTTPFAGKLYYSKYEDTRAYVDLTILTAAKAINTHAPEHEHTATIFVDGLKRTEQHRFASGLRKLRVHVRKVRGMNDQSDIFIRLADALAGFVRDSLAGDEILHPLYLQAIGKKKIIEV